MSSVRPDIRRSDGGSELPTTTLRGQIFRFGIVGVVAFLANAIVVEIASPFLGPVWGQIIAFPVAATIAWWLNRRFTFGPSSRKPHHELMRYIAANLFGWCANNGTYFFAVLSTPFIYAHPALGVAAGSVAGMALNFVASKQLVFRN